MTKVLWISRYAPISNDYSAGSRSFYYYFNQFKNDDRFDIRLICNVLPDKREIAEKENADIKHDFIFWPSTTKERLKNVINIESKFNPFNRNAGLISNTDVKRVKQILCEYQREGYIPDVVILEWTNMVFLAKEVKNVYPSCFLVATEHDVTFVGYERKAMYYKGLSGFVWKIRYKIEKREELDSLSHCDLVFPLNPDNAQLLINEGIDEKKIRWLVPYYEDFSSCNRHSEGRDIIFYGAMAREENSLSAIWFIENVMPLLDDIDVRFIVVGNRPPEKLLKMANDRIVITGFVDTIQPYFETGLCFVAPLVLGAGIKIKVLESLSSGIPVLTNTIGIEGIRIKAGKDYYHCESAKEYANVIRELYGKKEEKEISAKETIIKEYSYKDFAQVYKEIIFNKGK